MRASYRVFEYLREKKITAGFKDLGAGGIMGCTAELCAAGGYGAIIDLDDVNVAIENLPPEVIAVGETQERLCWILPGDVTLDVLRIYNEEFSLPEIARGARAVVIGAVQDEKRYVMRHGSAIVMDVPIDFLTGAISEARANCHPEVSNDREALPSGPERSEGLPQALAGLNACSREPLYKQYDAVVRGTTVIPRGHADAGVIAPVPGAPFGVALGVAGSVSEAVRRVVAVGARPLGLTDCLNFGNPNNEEHYAELVRAVSKLAADAEVLNLPFVSGNVSLYNESSSGRAIPSSPIIGCVGAVDDLRKVVTLGFKHPESDLYFVGTPGVSVVREAIDKELVLSAGAVGSAGLLGAAARMSFAADNDFGADFSGVKPFTDEFEGWLIEAGDSDAFEHIAAARLPAVAWRHVGVTTVADIAGEVDISIGESSWDLDDLRTAWSKPLTEIYG